MSELQLGLLAIGVLLVAGVFAYNRYQERSAQRGAQERFRSAHDDVLLEPQHARKEPAGPAPKPPAAAAARIEPATGALPDPRIDYVVDLAFAVAQNASAIAEQWKPNEHRFAGQVLFAASGGGASWRRLDPTDSLPIESLRAGLQLVTRGRTVNEVQLIEFRAALDTLADALGASVQAPEVRQAVESARDLERFCDDADVQVVVHIAAAEGAGLPAERVRAAALEAGFAPSEPGRYALRDADDNPLYLLTADGAEVSVTLDVPRVRDFPQVFRSMARFAEKLAHESGGRLVDDNRHPLDERALQAITAQLDGVRAQFEARGIAAGSPAALRLFS